MLDNHLLDLKRELKKEREREFKITLGGGWNLRINSKQEERGGLVEENQCFENCFYESQIVKK